RSGVEPPPDREDINWFQHHSLQYVSRPLFLDGGFVGTLYIIHDLDSVRQLLIRNSLFFLLALVTCLGLVSILTLRIQKHLSSPIISLAETAERVHTEQNYAIRSLKYGDDDLGTLVDRFNGMLDGIQRREAQLKEARDP
ncbi:MAG: hypothetical protein QF675_06750, partial [SAR324 cluster bacterium]|nr:hypothetical protein [SAR324 cluster bacterium]